MDNRTKRIEIAKALSAAFFVITGNEIPLPALDVMVEDLALYDLESINRALSLCRRECKGRVSLGDILDRLEGMDGRPGSEEAWMTALLAEDEAETVIWTEEMMQAFEVARPALAIRDKVGARMAFREAYDRLVKQSRLEKRPVAWSASLGFDVELRRIALEAAALTGKLLPSQVAGLLPPPPPDPDALDRILKLACVNGETVDQSILDREVKRDRINSLRAILAKKSA